uniref:Uncharacterized protein n=1 Tax=Rhizophora mucronata TaxID=61149 RepID=A0A2P2NWK9_RHIMU
MVLYFLRTRISCSNCNLQEP